MLGVTRTVIAEHERGLLFKDRSLQTLLGPGRYRFVDPFGRIEVERYDITEPEFAHPHEELLLREHGALLGGRLLVVELGEREAGLVYKNERLSGILPPGARQLYWRGPVDVRVERIDVAASYRVPGELAALLRQPRGALRGDVAGAVLFAEVSDYQTGLLLIDGELAETLPPGSHAFWTFQRSLKVELVERRLQALDVSGQEILSKDKLSLRLNLAAVFRVDDPVLLRAKVGAGREFLYRELQFALRQAVGARTLDELLADKSALDDELFRHVAGRAAAVGVELQGVGVKDVILPGDMKEILNQVVEAEKVAQANVIKRREETSATRSLLNTAKLMDDNPTLLRLKELEAVEKIAANVERLTVYGGLEGLLGELLGSRKDAAV